VGHTFICGPTGGGKTVIIGFLISMLTKFNCAQIIIDKDRGLEILVRALGGEYLPLRNGSATGCNPLQLRPTPANVDFLKAWLRLLAQTADGEGAAALPVREEADLELAIRGTLALEVAERRLSRLIEFLDPTTPDGVYARLSKWCYLTGGEYAWAFDNPDDLIVPRLAANALIGFDCTDQINHALIRTPMTAYLLHLIGQLLGTRRLVCWMDEFQALLSDPSFAAFADRALPTWRKLDGVLCMATQSPRKVLESPISRSVIEQTPTKVFLPNNEATREDYIDGFGLTLREFKLIKEQLEPGSRSCLIKQGRHSVVCQLDLQGFMQELAVISGRSATVDLMNRLISAHGPTPDAWLPAFYEAAAAPRATPTSGNPTHPDFGGVS
jgi:type IV secretion system protein VirB4